MKFPSIIVSALIVAAVAALQYLSGHVGSFGLPDVYAPLITLAIATVIKLIQEWKPQEEAQPRGLSESAGYAARVLYK